MPLVVDVPVGAVDLDLGSVEQAYQMVLPPKFKPLTQDDFYHITPLTTALWVRSRGAGGWWGSNLPGVMADQQKREQLMNSLEQAVDRVVYHYNIPEQKIYEDFIATGIVKYRPRPRRSSVVCRNRSAPAKSSNVLILMHSMPTWITTRGFETTIMPIPGLVSRSKGSIGTTRVVAGWSRVSDDFLHKIFVLSDTAKRLM